MRFDFVFFSFFPFKFMYVDQAWERVIGYSAMDVMGKASHDFFSCSKCPMIEAISLNVKEVGYGTHIG